MEVREFNQDLYAISKKAYIPESDVVAMLTSKAEQMSKQHDAIAKQAANFIGRLREAQMEEKAGLESFFVEYGLDSNEGRAIMALAEALPRIPDTATANHLIQDKLKDADWDKHVGHSSSGLVNISTRGLQIVSDLFHLGPIVSTIIDPVVRESIKRVIRKIGQHYVLGESIEKALEEAVSYEKKGFLFSYDCLGEAARTEEQAMFYTNAYLEALDAVAVQQKRFGKARIDREHDIYACPGISVKLSALYSQYRYAKHDAVFQHLVPRLRSILHKAAENYIPVTIDAEELYRLDISLEVFNHVIRDEALKHFHGIGLAIQAYHKRAYFLCEWVAELSKALDREIPVRLVKGAYWDAEIKHAQIYGLEDYEVFTRKEHTDISYLACASLLLDYAGKGIYPQFATHNAYSIAAIIEYAKKQEKTSMFEFQRLYGMGEGLFDQIVHDCRCRIYAPVGEYKDLLPYLIRRLLENGANNAFVKQLVDPAMPVKELVLNPMAVAISHQFSSQPSITKPLQLFGQDRENSRGYELGNAYHMSAVMSALHAYSRKIWFAGPLVKGSAVIGESREVFRPYDKQALVGNVIDSDEGMIREAMDTCHGAFERWAQTSVEQRSKLLEAIADELEKHKNELYCLCMREAGKTIQDAIDEVREAIDFCRYYAEQARKLFDAPQWLKGPTGESNRLAMYGRGVFLCISPWNFPLAIFTGQISAALAAGNTVVAKPAAQTSLIAYRVVELMLKAGLPSDVISFLPGNGATIGNIILQDNRLGGVAFTGSTQTAWHINRTLSERQGPVIPFIAETGGMNAMIVDSSAMLERACDDIIESAFGSAGQRCSALRVLFVQKDIAQPLLAMLRGAVREIEVGNPEQFSTDVGPVIDAESQHKLELHLTKMQEEGETLDRADVEEENDERGCFIPPHIIRIKSMSQLKEEVFGPILHVIEYEAEQLDNVIAQINDSGYGLTLGIHSRIESRIDYIMHHVQVGNHYVNRTMIGAKVGVQPFGGERLSGTGPKAGAPYYLYRFALETS